MNTYRTHPGKKNYLIKPNWTFSYNLTWFSERLSGKSSDNHSLKLFDVGNTIPPLTDIIFKRVVSFLSVSFLPKSVKLRHRFPFRSLRVATLMRNLYTKLQSPTQNRATSAAWAWLGFVCKNIMKRAFWTFLKGNIMCLPWAYLPAINSLFCEWLRV